LGDVPPLEVAYLVGEDREQLGRSELLDVRVEDGHPLVPSETGEEGIGLGRATRSVDQEDVPQGKIARARVGEDGVPRPTGGGGEAEKGDEAEARRDRSEAETAHLATEPTEAAGEPEGEQ